MNWKMLQIILFNKWFSFEKIKNVELKIKCEKIINIKKFIEINNIYQNL